MHGRITKFSEQGGFGVIEAENGSKCRFDKSNFTLSAWERLSNKPAGKWAFSRLVCLKAPYFGSIRPAFVELRLGYCELHIKKRRAVLNQHFFNERYITYKLAIQHARRSVRLLMV